MVKFFVEGIPIPQGSKTPFIAKGRAVVRSDNDKVLRPWRKRVAEAAALAREAHGVTFPAGVPVVVKIRFGMPRGVTVTREYPSVRPDVDKLLRAVLDGITTSGLYADDGQVTDLRIKERYSDRPGAFVKVSRMPGLIGGKSL